MTAGKTLTSKAIKDQELNFYTSEVRHILHVMTLNSLLFIVTLCAACTSACYLSINRLKAVKAGTCSLVSECVNSRAVMIFLWFQMTAESSNYFYTSFRMILITEKRGCGEIILGKDVSYKLSKFI